MATYVMADIHGRRKEFYQMLEEINFGAKDTLYILGDVLDRGPEGLALLLEIMDMKNVEMIIGNHEQMALEFFEGGDFHCDDATFWRVINGGEPTVREWFRLNKAQQGRIVAFLQKMEAHKVICVEGVKHCFVHGGLIPIKGFTVEELIRQQEKKLTWTRHAFYGARAKFEDAVVVAGHTPTECIDPKFKGRIWGGMGAYADRILIDCGAETLGCLRLEDRAAFYVGRQ